MKSFETGTAVDRGTGQTVSRGAENTIEVLIDPGRARDTDIQRFFGALSELNEALGGKGISYREVGLSKDHNSD